MHQIVVINRAMVHGNCDYHSFARFGKTFQMCDSVVLQSLLYNITELAKEDMGCSFCCYLQFSFVLADSGFIHDKIVA